MKKRFHKNREALVINFFGEQSRVIRLFFFTLAALAACLTVYLYFNDKSHQNENFKVSLVFSISCLVIYFFLLIKLFDKKISGKDYLKLLEEDLVNAYSMSFKSFGISEENLKFANPIVCFSPEIYPYCGRIDYKACNKTGNLYYSQSKFSAIMFGEEEVYFYNSNINHILGTNSFEEAIECRYDDIVNITTKTDIIKIRNIFHDHLKITFTLKDSTKTSIILRNKIYTSKSFSSSKFSTLSNSTKLLLLLTQVLLFSGAFAYFYIIRFLKLQNSLILSLPFLAPMVVFFFLRKTFKVSPSATPINEQEFGIIKTIRSLIRQNKKMPIEQMSVKEEANITEIS